jgi:hypothetical protein
MVGYLEIGLNNELLQVGFFFVVESSSRAETLFLIVKAVDWTIMWCNMLTIPSTEGKAGTFLSHYLKKWHPHTYIKVCLSIYHNIEAKKDPLL